eukprot:g5103.t1
MKSRGKGLPPSLKVSSCGTEIANGIYKKDDQRGLRHGAYRYIHTKFTNVQLTKERTRTGMGWILGDPVQKMVYFAAKGDVDVPPIKGWKAYLGSNPVPVVKQLHSRRSLEGKPQSIAGCEGGEKVGVGITKQPSGFLGKATTKAEEQRKRVYDEITDTEAQYIDDMRNVLTLFANPMQRDKIVTKEDCDAIFSNLGQIVAINATILRQIKYKRKSQILSKVIADVFHANAAKMSVYTTYCINYHNALKTVKRLKATNTVFVQFLDSLASNVELRGLNLESLLIKPVQRICKYQLFLRDLLKSMDKEHKNRPLIEKALADVKQTATKVNDAMQENEATRKVVEIYNSVLDLPHDLVAPSRKFELESKVDVTHVGSSESPENFKMIVFTDLLILTIEEKSFWGETTGIFRCVHTFDLRNLTDVRYDGSSKEFQFKHKEFSDKTITVSKYVFAFRNAGVTKSVARVLQGQVDRSKEKAVLQEKRASTRRTGLRKFHAHRRTWGRSGTTGKASLKDIEQRYRQRDALAAQTTTTTTTTSGKSNGVVDNAASLVAEPPASATTPARSSAQLRSWATRKGRASVGRRMPEGLKRAEKKALLKNVATLEREHQNRAKQNATLSTKKNAAFRESCYVEIAETEKQFYKDLRCLVDEYMEPMAQKGLLTTARASTIFRNVREIMNLSKELYNALNREGQRSQIFADAFAKYSPFFDMYTIYCSGYGRAVDCLKECRSKNTRLQKWLASKSGTIGLDSMLVKPVQRICKYPLFFRGLLKHMEEGHPSRPKIVNAMNKIKAVASKVDDKVREWSERAKVIDVYNTVKD